MKINHEPVGPVLIVSVDDIDEDVSEGGIVLSTKKISKMHGKTGTVLKMGHGCFKDLMEISGLTECPVKVGDKVLFNRYEGELIPLDKEEKELIRFVRDTKIWGVIKDE